MTPEAYLAAVKMHPRVVVRGFGGFRYNGYAIRREGDHVAVIPPDVLGKDNLRAFAERSTSDHLYASSGCWHHVGQIVDGELPSKEQLRGYFVSKHGKLRGLNRLSPMRCHSAGCGTPSRMMPSITRSFSADHMMP
jgi:hypothetical protein